MIINKKQRDQTMKLANILLTLLAFALFSTAAVSSPQEPLDGRIEQWVQKTCGKDAVCAEKKRSHYRDRMAKYKQHVHEKCGDDETCRQEMRNKYMERRAKREARIAEHCGDDEACRDELREKYSHKMKDAREQCGDNKACWKALYKEHKPKND